MVRIFKFITYNVKSGVRNAWPADVFCEARGTLYLTPYQPIGHDEKWLPDIRKITFCYRRQHVPIPVAVSSF
jgi:hypothetical protein